MYIIKSGIERAGKEDKLSRNEQKKGPVSEENHSATLEPAAETVEEPVSEGNHLDVQEPLAEAVKREVVSEGNHQGCLLYTSRCV